MDLKTTILSSFIIGSMLLVAACDRESSEQLDKRLSDSELSKRNSAFDEDKNTLLFGFDVRSSLKEDARQYLPFLDYLQRSTGYTFKLHFTPKHGNIVHDVGTAKVQFAALGAVSYIQARKKYNATPLVRGINNHGKDRYRSFLVVRSASKIQRLQDIKGKRFAFGSKNSTQGHLLPRIIFIKHQINLKDLRNYKFTGSHLNCLNSVILNEADVCGMQDVMAEDAARSGKVKVLHRSDWYPSSGIVAGPNVPPEVRNKVKAALQAFNPNGRDAKKLYNWEKTEMAKGFIEASDKDYDDLRRWIKKLALREFN